MTHWIDQIAVGLSKLGWKVRLFGIADAIADYSDSLYEVTPVPTTPPGALPLGLIDKWWRWNRVARFFSDWTRHNPPPRLRLSDGTPGAIRQARVLSGRDGTPWVTLMGGDVFAETERVPFAGWLHQRILGDLTKTKLIFVDGNDLIESLTQRGIPRDKTRLQYHGIDLERFPLSKGDSRFFPKHTEGRLRLVWHGRLSGHHGPLRFLDIAEKVAGVEARMCGAGPEESCLRQRLAGMNRSDWWLGVLPGEDLGPFLAEGECGVYPLESMAGVPTVVLESMAAGLATVTYPVGSVSELVRSGDNGFLCADREEAVRILEKLRDDPELRSRVGRAARKTVEESWTVEVTIRSLEEELLRILSEK